MLDPGQGLGKSPRCCPAPRHAQRGTAELLALDAVLQPMEAHVDAFRQARRDRLVSQAHGDLVVTKEVGGGLRVPQVVEDGALIFG